jgi:putative ABC transport system substrate-binding protein
MKKIFLILAVLSMAVLAGCGKKGEEKVINIGITQIVEHPSLDEIRRGIIETLDKNGYVDGKNIKINFQNAQGEMSNAQLIAKEFNDNEDIVVAITTPSAQAALNAIKEKPIFFSAVTDPIAAGLQADNITGTSDATPIEKQLEFAKKVVAKMDKIGIIYNLGEANSEVQVKKVKELEEKYGYKLRVIGINNVNEISQGLDAILDDIDVLYTPIDNLLASSYPLIIKRTSEKNIPVLGAVADFVEKGAFGTEGINQYNIGVQTANMIIRYLKDGTNLKDMPFETVENTDLVLNMKAIKGLGLSVSEDLEKRAIIVE